MKQVLFMTNIGFFFNYSAIVRTTIISSALLLTGCGGNNFKTGYIDINVINKEYTLAQQYETKLKNLEDASAQSLFDLQNQIDEVSSSIKKQQDANKEIPQGDLKTLYLLRKKMKEVKDKSLAMIKDSTFYYRTLLNDDINSKVFEFGKTHNYKYVFNPAGSGSFMYADSTLDITQEVVEYLNSKK